ncbi:MAG: CHASE2 domain-containing protein [Bryobacteraceae bacterium]
MRRIAYIATLTGCLLVGTLAGWTALGLRVDNYVYDQLTSLSPAPEKRPQGAVVVAIDEATLQAQGGMRNIRPILANALDQLSAAQPKAVALDLILADKGDDADDARLEAAMRATKNLILDCELVGGKWEDPLPRFRSAAAALGHVHPEQDRLDGVSRFISLEETGDGANGRERRWALSLEAYRLANGQEIVESPEELSVGATEIPAARSEGARPLLIRYLPDGVETVSALTIRDHAAQLRGRVVFVGVTALSAARDRLVNPYGQNVPGVEVHAHAFETMAGGQFLTRLSNAPSLGMSIAFAAAAGLAFAFLSGWMAYVVAVLILAVAHIAPVVLFRQGFVLPYFGPTGVAWLSCAGAATYQHFFVRRQLSRAETEKARYQQAIHWAAHEMRTPLTAIQGSSEIMTNYSLTPEKSKQLSEMINAESKRLAKLIQTFLNVERLAEGHMELKRDPFSAAEIVETCMARVTPLAERKKIRLSLDTGVEGTLVGDRELMEYALYNILTNAVKYSPAGTEIHVTAERKNGELRVAVRDQGIGMDSKELKNIFQKFYRTKKAEASGEAGTGIGLSIVEQIVTHHGGRMEVTSDPGKGSCFTMVLAANAETADRRG